MRQIALLLLEAAIVSGLLLVFFRLRNRFGLSPLCVTLGAFQHLQTELAATLYLPVWPGIFVSPGSAVLFTATLFTTLLMYIRDDAAATRSLIVGIVAANVTLTIVMLITQLQITTSPGLVEQASQTLFFLENTKPLIIGTTILCIDVVLIIVLYEFFYRVFPRSLFMRVSLAMFFVVVIDTVIFVSINFYGADELKQILLSGIVGKGAMAVFYSSVMVMYLRLFPAVDHESSKEIEQHKDIFHILTYRQRYELLKDELTRDSMTGLFNRGFFNKNLPQELERASRLQHDLNLMLVDLDNFKKINDEFGHQAGDQVITLLAESMRASFRAADIPCRYGGEEFAVILPDSSAKAAFIAAQRLRRKFREKCDAADLTVPVQSITFTAGIASFPGDATTADELLRIADNRLYAGKNAGRDCVINAASAVKSIPT